MAVDGVQRRYHDIVFKMNQEQCHERQDSEEEESKRCEDLIGLGVALRVFVEGGVQNDVLIRENHQNSQKESNRKGRRESFEDKGTEDAQGQVYHSRPDSGNGECDGPISGSLQADHYFLCLRFVIQFLTRSERVSERQIKYVKSKKKINTSSIEQCLGKNSFNVTVWKAGVFINQI